jgi:hypothetical protein
MRKKCSSDNNTARNSHHTEDNIVALNEEAAEPSVDHSLDETSQCWDFLTTSVVKELPFPPLVLDQSQLIASDRIMQGHNTIQSDTDEEKEEMNYDKTRAFRRFPTTINNNPGLMAIFAAGTAKGAFFTISPEIQKKGHQKFTKAVVFQ